MRKEHLRHHHEGQDSEHEDFKFAGNVTSSDGKTNNTGTQIHRSTTRGYCNTSYKDTNFEDSGYLAWMNKLVDNTFLQRINLPKMIDNIVATTGILFSGHCLKVAWTRFKPSTIR